MDRRPAPFRFARWLAPAAVAITMIVTTFAEAQERSWSLRDLFKPRQERQWPAAPPPARAKRPSPARPAKVATPQRPSQEARQVAAPQETIEKAADARIVLVIGDFIASSAAEGIEAIFAQDSHTRIVDRSNGSSGLVRNDHFDWPGRVPTILEELEPAAVVIALGANDRQTMSIGSERQPLRSDPWMREYRARAASLLSELQMAGVPVIWLGMPSFKSSRMNADILAFNEVYRKIASDAGIEYVEVWDGFVNEEGRFISTGPDVNGQPVRLRTDDGINLTAAGKRKLAFYAEKPLRALLGAGSAPGAPAGTVPGSGPMVAAPNRTAPMALNDPALDGGDTLLGSGYPIATSTAAQPGSEVAGRADDFLLPGAQAGGTPGTESPDRSTTSALRGTVRQP